MDYRQLITVDPHRRSGKPSVRDTRITAHDVLSWLADDMTHSKFIEDLPQFTDEDIRSCFAFAA